MTSPKLRMVASPAAEARAAETRRAREEAADAAELAAAQEAIEVEHQAKRDAEQRERDTAEMHEAIAFVSALPSRLAPELRALVDLDRQASLLVDCVYDQIVTAQEAHARATKLAEKLECPAVVQRQIASPAAEWVALLARVAIALDRKRTGRDLQNGWLEAASEPPPNTADRRAYDAALNTVKRMETP